MNCFYRLVSVVFVVLCLSSMTTNSQDTTEFRYSSHFDTGSSFSLTPSENSIRFLDLISSAEYCDKDDEYFCVNSTQLSFAVPKNKYEKSQSWVLGGFEYKKVESKVVKIMGSSHFVDVIAVIDEGLKTEYLYSLDKGLIAIKLTDLISKASKEYYLTSAEGFASNNKN